MVSIALTFKKNGKLQSRLLKAGIGIHKFCRSSPILKVIYHPLYSINKFVTDKSKLRQDGAQVFPYMG